MNLRDLRLRLRALIVARRVERELDEELAFHIGRETAKLVERGLSRDDAHAQARARFGSMTVAADACRDVRGVGIVDSTLRDFAFALRTLRRAPVVSLTIVGTVALGLGLVAAVFTLFNLFAFRVDAVRDPHELYAVKRVAAAPGSADTAAPTERPFTRPDYDSLRRGTSVFTDAIAKLPDITSRIDGRVMEGTLVTGNFFQVLGVTAAIGRTLSPEDDDRVAGRPVMVLSHTGWSRRFSGDPAVLGHTLHVNGFPFHVVGVMPDGFRGLSIGAPDYWAPLTQLARFRPIHAGREDMVAIEIIGRLRPGLSAEAALAGLGAWASAQSGAVLQSGQPVPIALEPRNGTLPAWGEMLTVITPVFFAFGLILLIGCANVANLLLARAVARQREIGIRLSLGASRRRIVRQLLTESLLLALAAAACGYAVARLVLEATVYAVTTTMAPELAETFRLSAPPGDWRVVGFLGVGAAASTVFFGLVPALQATRVELVRTMRGEVTRDAHPGRARHALIALQVMASALLLICAAVFLRSTLDAATADSGLRTEDTVIVDIVNEPHRRAMLDGVHTEPAVDAVAASWPDPMGRPREAFAKPDGASSREPVSYRLVSPEYFDVLGISIRRGRGFTDSEGTSAAGVVLLSEATARTLWPSGDPIGRVVQIDPDPASETRRSDEPTLSTRVFTVVGIVDDVPGFRLSGFEEAGVYLPANHSMAETAFIVRVRGDPELARRALLDRLTPIDPNMGEVMTLRTLAGLETYFFQIAFWIALVLGALALVLTLSGLFGVVSYLVEQRTKEIAVQMALGATAGRVAGAVLRQSFRPVATGLVIGAAMAIGLATLLLATPLAELIGDTVDVLDPLAYAASLLCIVAACTVAALVPALRATRIDPMTTLRQD